MSIAKREPLIPELKNLPRDVWTQLIGDFLGLPEHRILSRISRSFGGLTRDNSIWKKRFERHFPERYAQLEKKQDVNWYAEFIAATAADYQGLPKPVRQLFYIAKEGNTQYLLIQDLVFFEQLLDYYDVNKVSAVEWLLRNKHQPMLDTIFKRVFPQPQSITKKYFKDQQGWDRAHWAVICNQPEHVLSKELGQRDFANSPMTPFHVAAQYGLTETLKFLLPKFEIDHRTVIVDDDQVRQKTALHLAAERGQLDSVKFLVENKADCAATKLKIYNQNANDSLVTALHYAARYNHTGVAEFLVKKISPLLHCRKHLKTPLFYAVVNKNRKMFDTFIEQIKALSLSTPWREAVTLTLQAAVQNGDHYYIKPLLEIGADPNWARSTTEHNTFDMIVDRGDRDAMKAILGNRRVDQIQYVAPQIPLLYVLGPQSLIAVLGLLGVVLDLTSFPEQSDWKKALAVVGIVLVTFGFIFLATVMMMKKFKNLRSEKALNLMREVVDKHPELSIEKVVEDEETGLLQNNKKLSLQYNTCGLLKPPQTKSGKDQLPVVMVQDDDLEMQLYRIAPDPSH